MQLWVVTVVSWTVTTLKALALININMLMLRCFFLYGNSELFENRKPAFFPQCLIEAGHTGESVSKHLSD